MKFLYFIVIATSCVAVFIVGVAVTRLCRKRNLRKRYSLPSQLLVGAHTERGTIPRLLHRIWIGPRTFPPYKDLPWIESFERANDDFTPIVWKDEEVRKIIEEKYPEYANIYHGYRLNIQRADLARYLVLYEFGGMYADLDMSGIQPVSELLERYPESTFFSFEEIVLTEQKALEIGEGEPIRREGNRMGLSEIPEDTQRIASYTFLCAPKHPVMLEILKEAKRRAGLPVKRQYDVFYTTGPDLFTTVVHRYLPDDPGVTVIDKQTADGFFIHKGSATWKTFINFPFR
jgi:mannosyltransferase OCH1-like enzyme